MHNLGGGGTNQSRGVYTNCKNNKGVQNILTNIGKVEKNSLNYRA